MDAKDPNLELLFLHALPLDGSMWAAQRDLLPGATYAPTLYGLGDSITAWAAQALKLIKGNRVVVVGCSVGGSCALELALAAPDRIAALVLIGTKAGHRPDPDLHASAIDIIQGKGMEEAWRQFWAPALSSSADEHVIDRTKRIALRQSPQDVARGVTVFHTRPDRDQMLATFPRPVAVVTGADDRFPGPHVSSAQARAVPQGSLHVVPECGHYVPLERPGHLNAILRGVIGSLQQVGPRHPLA